MDMIVSTHTEMSSNQDLTSRTPSSIVLIIMKMTAIMPGDISSLWDDS